MVYEEELQKYLKITGLQASDLAKPRSKKKDSSKNSSKSKAAASQPTPQPTAAHTANNQSAMHAMFRPQLAAQMAAAAQMAGFPGSAGQAATGTDGLPHFSQVWATGSGPIAGSQAPPGYAASGYANQANSTTASQQMAGGDTAAAAAWLWPQLLQQQQQQYGAASFDAVQQAMHQALQQQQQAASLQQQQVLQQQALLARSQNGAAEQSKKTDPSTPNDNASENNGSGDVSQQRNNGNVSFSISLSSNTLSSTIVSQSPHSEPIVHANTIQSSRPPSFGLPTISNSVSSNGIPIESAHNQYNSYAFNPWKVFPEEKIDVKPVFCKENIIESELAHLRSALSEKTKEVQLLTQQLEKAYDMIDQLRDKT